MTQDMDRKSHLKALGDSLDSLIAFAEQEDDFVLAAKLDDARIRFTNLHSLNLKYSQS